MSKREKPEKVEIERVTELRVLDLGEFVGLSFQSPSFDIQVAVTHEDAATMARNIQHLQQDRDMRREAHG
jgi:hypothetical protein